ncbi:MAG: NADPH:quinone oxidoreductase family protein [Halieaceae bacterium]|nr:NADPH:quinone oxidoreductase family protein [Halieaceae bacterium]
MRSVVCEELGPEENLRLRDVPVPELEAGKVLIDMRAAALNFPDVLQIRGKYQHRQPLPFPVGGEGAGIVSAIGEGVGELKTGDRVIALGKGALADKMLVDETHAVLMPQDMDFRSAAGFITTYATSWYALNQRGALREGETLLVLGAGGGVGTSAIEIGKAMGATVIAAASTAEKLALAEQLGADHLINYSEQGLKDTVKEITGGRGADLIYDPVGGDYSEQALRAIARGGRFLVIGFAAGDIPRIPLNLPLLKSCAIVGVFWGAFTIHEPAENAKNMEQLLQLYSAGKLKPMVKDVFPLEQYVAAFNCLSERRARGKVILDIA